MGNLFQVVAIAITAVTLSFSAQATEVFLGHEAHESERQSGSRLSGMTEIEFKERTLDLPMSNFNEEGWDVSVALKPPQTSRAPIYFLLPGATQEKTSYAAMIRDLHDIDPRAGIFTVDLFGQGETLEAMIPLNRDINLEDNGAMIAHLHKKLRRKYRSNKIVMVGISYGAGTSLSAAFQSKKIQEEMAVGKTRIVVMSFGEEALVVTNQINLQAGLLKLFWPNPNTEIKPFRDWFTAMSVYSQAAMAEPIILRKPFPWTLEANFRILSGVGSMDFDALGEAIPEKSLDVILTFDDAYLERGWL